MPPQLFTSGFESASYAGDGWDVTTVSGGGQSLGVTAAARRVGTYGSQSVLNSTAADQSHEAKVTKLISDTVNQKVYVQTWVRLASVASVGYGAVGSKAILALRAADDQPLVWLAMRSGGLILAYMQRNNVIASINSFIPVTAGQWYGFRLLIDRAGFNPLISGWFSTDGTTWTSLGTAVDGMPGSDGVAKRPARVDVGIAHIANFETGQYTVHHDDVEIRHSLGAVTDWSAIAGGGAALTAALSGRGVSYNVAVGATRLLGSGAGVQERPARFVTTVALVGPALGSVDVASEVLGLLLTSGDASGVAERLGLAAGAVRLVRVPGEIGSGIVSLSSGSMGLWLITRTLTEVGIPTAVLAAEASVQGWGVAVASDEAYGGAEISDQPLGVAVASDERG